MIKKGTILTILISGAIFVLMLFGAALIIRFFASGDQSKDEKATTSQGSSSQDVSSATQGLQPQGSGGASPAKGNQTVEGVASSTTQSDMQQSQRVAQSFVERFGSFTNQRQYENLKDLFVFMTDAMKQWAEQFIAENSAKGTENSAYYGITTYVRSLSTVSFDEKAATAIYRVSTQRREVKEVNSSPNIFQQDIVVHMKKVDGVWNIDAAYWQ